MGKSAGRMYDVLFLLFSVFFDVIFSVNLLRKLQFEMYKCILLVGPEGSNYQRYQTEWQVIVVCSWPFKYAWWLVVACGWSTCLAYIWRAAVGGTNLYAYTTMRTHACIPTFMHERKRLCMFSTTVLGLQRHLAARPSRLMQIILRSTSLLPNCYLPDHIVYVASNVACPLGSAFVHNIPIMNMMVVTS